MMLKMMTAVLYEGNKHHKPHCALILALSNRGDKSFLHHLPHDDDHDDRYGAEREEYKIKYK